MPGLRGVDAMQPDALTTVLDRVAVDDPRLAGDLGEGGGRGKEKTKRDDGDKSNSYGRIVDHRGRLAYCISSRIIPYIDLADK